MNIREWALITFTILGQMASGAMLVLMVVRAYLAMKSKTEVSIKCWMVHCSLWFPSWVWLYLPLFYTSTIL